MSASIYDTAWVSMIRKPSDAGTEWLFPQCFQRLVELQNDDGSWQSYLSQADGILNTAAALLAVQKHLTDDDAGIRSDLTARSSRAQKALERMLNEWDVDSCDQVGFEVLITRHLEFLEDEGIYFHFPARADLVALCQRKLAAIPPSVVETVPTALLHSLEALVGKVCFDKMRHLRSQGSMLASPASTAVYLMNTSSWDSDAEAYLRATLDRESGDKDGLVPCAWPTTIFELSWVLTALQQAGFSVQELGLESVSTIGTYLEDQLAAQKGWWVLVGFPLSISLHGMRIPADATDLLLSAPSCLPDADDTARMTLALRGIGKAVDSDALVKAFEADSHFLTYKGERNPSFTTNCNVAACLLSMDDPSKYTQQIGKCIGFLCAQAFRGDMKDKWNTSKQYPMMLFSETLLRFVERLNDGSLSPDRFSPTLLSEEIPILTLQVLMQLLGTQEADGSWQSKHEVTAYSILALVALAAFPWMQDRNDEIKSAIEAGQQFLEKQRTQWSHGDYLWIEKVTYSSNVLSLSYCLAASRTTARTKNWTSLISGFNDVPTERLSKFVQFFHRLPLFQQVSTGKLRAAFIQSHYFLKMFHRTHPDIFPRDGGKEYSHLAYIPFTWTACNVWMKMTLSPKQVQEMILLSDLIYQADEFMETAVQQDLCNELGEVRALIHHLCSTLSPNDRSGSGRKNGFRVDSPMESESFARVESVLGQFIRYVLQHPQVVQSHPRLQRLLSWELKAFLLAHVQQAEDNRKFSQTYYSWVRGPSAETTSCPFAFVFFCCLFASSKSDPFLGPRRAYLIEDVIRHLATLCRQYNDYGSTVRDCLEQNLNSVNFPEFHARAVRAGRDDLADSQQQMKEDLMWIADFERRQMMSSLDMLDREGVDQTMMQAVRLYMGVTDLYGQMYVQKDLTSRNR